MGVHKAQARSQPANVVGALIEVPALLGLVYVALAFQDRLLAGQGQAS